MLKREFSKKKQFPYSNDFMVALLKVVMVVVTNSAFLYLGVLLNSNL